MLSIAAFARLAGVSAKALRAYDALGLFRPVWVDPQTRYRYYSPAQLPELRRILALRQLGIGLPQIARLITGRANLARALEERRAEAERERADVERQLAALDIRVEMASDADPGLDVVVRGVPSLRVATLALDLVPGGDVSVAFYELEAHVRDARARANGPPGALVGVSRAAGGSGTDVFVPLSRTLPADDRIRPAQLPAALMATVIHRGPYSTLGEARRALGRWAEATRQTAREPLRVLYLQFAAERELALPAGYLVDRAAEFVTEIQLPLEPEPAALPGA